MLNLWTASWHDKPAGSLEDDDDVLADLAMCDPTRWDALKADVLHGWVKCSDGRLYHPVVSEKARQAWDAKLDQRWKTECARIKKHADRYSIVLQRPSFDAWFAGGCEVGQRLPVPGDDGVMSRGTPQGQREDWSAASATVPSETASKEEGQEQEQEEKEGQGQQELKTAAAPASNALAVPPAAGAASKRGTRLPPDWHLPKAWGVWAQDKYQHWTTEAIRTIADKFRNHWVAKTGKDATELDWFATWQNWCMSDITQRENPPPKTPASPADADAARQARLAEARALIDARGRVPGAAVAAVAAVAAAPNDPNVIDA